MNEASLIELLSNESEKISEESLNINSVIDTDISGWKENTSSTFSIPKQLNEIVKIRIRVTGATNNLIRYSSSKLY